ncbi:MAG: alpha/beta hydrolase [Chloroflexi bacterium]|nr:alpha/beta hydrolase [Chloroflexota bacterium]
MSLQAKIVKKLLPLQISGWSEGPIEEQRARQKKTIRYIKFPTDVRCQPVCANGVSAEWIETPDADLGVILYLHGGAYALGSIDTHREFVARLARATNMRGLAIDYRLAPEHPFPAALDDATTAYLWLLTQGFDPSRIIIAGDSAGGGLTLATLVALRDAGERLPIGAVCISPWMDLAMTGASAQNKAKVDLVLAPDILEKYARYYAVEHEVTAPLISPLYADLKGLPPLLIQVGTDEILLDDAVRCAEKARKAGMDVTLEIWDEMFHVFQMVSFLPETKKAVRSIAGFVSKNLNRTSANSGQVL